MNGLNDKKFHHNDMDLSLARILIYSFLKIFWSNDYIYIFYIYNICKIFLYLYFLNLNVNSHDKFAIIK